MDPDTPKSGETPVVTDPKTNANPVTTPPEVKTPDPEIEAARKRAEQAEMQANMLRNQLKAKEEAEAAAKAKELEEQNEFKTLYEQEKTKREEAEAAAAKRDREAALKAESDRIFAEFPDAVKELAQETGMTLADTDEASVATFKEKLEKIKGKLPEAKVTPNNPGNPTPQSDMTPQELHETLRDPKKFEAYITKKFKGIASMTQQAE